MDSSKTQLQILNHLRPYLRAIYNVNPDISRPIDLFGNSQYEVARYMLNKCYGEVYTNNDVAANFMCALTLFAQDVKKYDLPLKAESPVGLITLTTRNHGFIDFYTPNVGGLLQKAIQEELDSVIQNNIPIYDNKYKGESNLTLTAKITLLPEFVNSVMANLIDKINTNQIIRNLPECQEFIYKIDDLARLGDSLEIDIVKNYMGTRQYIKDLEANFKPSVDNERELIEKLFSTIVKEINKIASKCFEIPYLTYASSNEVRGLIDTIRTKDIDQTDLDIFFTLFSVIYKKGSQDVLLNNAQAVKQLNSSILPSVRINMKKLPNTRSLYMLENWLPTVPIGSFIYFSNVGRFTVNDQEQNSVKDYFSTIMLTKDYYGKFQQPFDDLVLFSQNDYKQISQCIAPTSVKSDVNVKTRLLQFISGKSEEKAGEKSKYLGTVLFDNNNAEEAKVLRASYNGWKLNKSTGTYEKNVNGKMVALDPSVDTESFYVSQCEALSLDEMTCTQLMEKILVDDSSSKSIADILNEVNFASAIANGKMRDVHPKLAKKILKNLGFKEIQFTTRLGTKVNIIEPYQNWLNRFVKSNKDLAGLYEILNSESGAELRLFLKLLIKAVNDEKTMSVLSEKEKGELEPDYSVVAQEKATMNKLSKELGIPVYKQSVQQKPVLSLEQIRRGFGPDIDLGLKIDPQLNFMNSYNDFNTISMSPFLFLVNKAFPGINITAPFRFTSTKGSMTGGSCSDYDGTEIDVNSGFDLKSKQLRNTWEELKSKIPIDSTYAQNLEGVVESIECGEASLLLNLARIKKLSELIKAEPSILADKGEAGVFTREEIATIANTFNQKMDEYTKRLNKGFDLLTNLENKAVLGQIELSDIVV